MHLGVSTAGLSAWAAVTALLQQLVVSAAQQTIGIMQVECAGRQDMPSATAAVRPQSV